MSSRPIERAAWSIQGRLLLLFTAGVAALLIGISAALYAAILHYMDQRAQDVLAERIADAREDLGDPGGTTEIVADLAAPITGEPEYWLRILDANGKTKWETRGMAERIPIAVFPASPDAGMARREYTASNGRWMSLALRNVVEQGSRYTIQVAEDRREDVEFLDKLRWMLGILIGAGTVLSAGLARLVTTRGLRPLKAMEQAVVRVRAPRLNERLGEQKWPLELRPLAAAFDEMMNRLEESFTRLSQFSADLAHELRTPIANLRGEAEVALSRGRSAEEYREVLESSMEEYERLTQMTSKLLFLARADAEEAEVKPEELNPREIIDSLWELYEPYAEEQGVALKREGEGMVKADAVLLRRAVANLVENALHFTPRGGEVVISVEERGVVRVRDTGCGIAAEHLPRLFDRFYQVDPARREGGTGLGLALVKSIMRLHGGTVAITSEPDSGTEATLRFPG